MAGPSSGAAFVMPIAGPNGKHVRAPDYPSAWEKKAGADGAGALALRRVIRGRAMQAPAVYVRRWGREHSLPALGSSVGDRWYTPI